MNPHAGHTLRARSASSDRSVSRVPQVGQKFITCSAFRRQVASPLAWQRLLHPRGKERAAVVHIIIRRTVSALPADACQTAHTTRSTLIASPTTVTSATWATAVPKVLCKAMPRPRPRGRCSPQPEVTVWLIERATSAETAARTLSMDLHLLERQTGVVGRRLLRSRCRDRRRVLSLRARTPVLKKR